jgi:NhaC family Na+:H+ antiporter
VTQRPVVSPAGRIVPFSLSALPVAVLLGLIGYALVLRPLALEQAPLPLELVFVAAAAFAIAQLLWLGWPWSAIQEAIVRRLSRAMPAFFILFAIGLLVGSWMVCGTIPMLVDFGVRLVDPAWLYALAFLVPMLFSTLTGTSWGSAGTIGVVLMGMGVSVGADAAIVAGAVIGGAYFGDKLSPLSDTTNMAAIGADVPLFEHIRSMLWTTVPAALFALAVYVVVGLRTPPAGAGGTAEAQAFLAALGGLFRYDALLLLPPLVVLVGTVRRAPTLPTLLASIVLAAGLALALQPFSAAEIGEALRTGFRVAMADDAEPAALPDAVRVLVERGGLYSMREAIFVAFLVFLFVGAIDLLDAMPRVVGRVFGFARGAPATVLAALGATAVTNAMTSNQSATSFIVGDAFQRRFDALRIPRRVLSRSIEDTGTMLESLVPWHATALFMVATLGVPVAEYWRWQLLSLGTFALAPVLAVTGIGCFYGEGDRTPAPAGGATTAGVEEGA